MTAVPLRERPFTADLMLAPGRYRFEADVFGPEGGQARLRASSGFVVLHERTVDLDLLMEAPTALEFDVALSPSPSLATVRLTVASWPPKAADAFMHAWRIRHVSAG